MCGVFCVIVEKVLEEVSVEKIILFSLFLQSIFLLPSPLRTQSFQKLDYFLKDKLSYQEKPCSQMYHSRNNVLKTEPVL